MGIGGDAGEPKEQRGGRSGHPSDGHGYTSSLEDNVARAVARHPEM